MNGQQSPTRIRTADTFSIDAPGSASLSPLNSVLTVPEIALELRCSKAHVHNLINGKVLGVRPLPSLRLGRRRLVRRLSLDEWIKANEQCYDPIIAKH
jgi:excisionase family DNA binding protein